MNNDASSILTVTMNPAVDKTYYVPYFGKGCMVRVMNFRELPGGKGINVTRVLHTLGYPVLATGFLGGRNGVWIEARLLEEGIASDFIKIPGETRATLTIVEETSGLVTELLEAGPVIDSVYADMFLTNVGTLAKRARFVTLSGSLPQGLAADFYAQVVERVQVQGALACVDTSGEALRLSLGAQPYLVKVNQSEFADMIGDTRAEKSETMKDRLRKDSVATSQEFALQLQKFRETHCQIAVVTFGPDGSVACDGQGVWYVSSPRVNTVNAVGSGDSFFAGLVGGLLDGLAVSDALALASAAGASNAAHPGAGQVNQRQVKELKELVRVVRLL
jgi:tagatose 6-phosphate kinase